MTGDGRADLIVGPGAGRAPLVKVFSGTTGAQVRQLTAFAPGMTAGVRVAVAYVTDDAYADVVVSTGPGAADRVRVFDGLSATPVGGAAGDFAPFGGTRTGGVVVAASNDPPVGDAGGGGGTGGPTSPPPPTSPPTSPPEPPAYIRFPGFAIGQSSETTQVRSGPPDLSYSDTQDYERERVGAGVYFGMTVTLTLSISVGKLVRYNPDPDTFNVEEESSYTFSGGDNAPPYPPGYLATLTEPLTQIVGVTYPAGYAGPVTLTVAGVDHLVPTAGGSVVQVPATRTMTWTVQTYDHGEYWLSTVDPANQPSTSTAPPVDQPPYTDNDTWPVGAGPLPANWNQQPSAINWSTLRLDNPNFPLPSGLTTIPTDANEIRSRRSRCRSKAGSGLMVGIGGSGCTAG